jgi:hypothetical protein
MVLTRIPGDTSSRARGLAGRKALFGCAVADEPDVAESGVDAADDDDPTRTAFGHAWICAMDDVAVCRLGHPIPIASALVMASGLSMERGAW